MRLLLRANAHRRPATGETEIAASPDTQHRERWQWDLRLVDGSSQPEHPEHPERVSDTVRLTRSDGSTSQLMVTADPGTVTAQLEVLDLDAPVLVERTDRELLVFVVGSGAALIEGRHALGEMDAMVLAGEDPTGVRIEQVSAGAVSVALVRLCPSGNGSLAWVP